MFRRALEKLRRFDWILLAAVFLLFCLGLAAIYSVSLGEAGSDFSSFSKQGIFGILGFGLLFLISLGSYSGWRVYSRWLHILTLALLLGVLLFGAVVHGTRGWFLIGGLRFQPVEIAKIALIVLLARFFSNRFQHFHVSKHIIVSLFLTLSLVVWILLQPDLGSAVILLGVWFLLLVLTGVRRRYLLLLVGIMVVVCVAGGFMLHDYQQERIKVFLSPATDPLGVGYNVTQAKVAIGSGGLWGKGLGFGSQSQLRFIPESKTDFLFAVIAEELGFVGVFLVIGFFLVIFYRLFMIARSARDDFGLFLVLGVMILLLLHLLVNVGMNLGIMPVMGISLPFLSYGGSFLLTCLILVGIAESVAMEK